MHKHTESMFPEGSWDFKVLVKGKPVREFNHKGEVFIEGREGTEYSLDLRNNTFQRVLMIPTVDGLSVFDGEPASYESRGYIVEPHTNVRIPGWQINEDEVAKFKFSDKKNSYVNKKGEDGINIGYIGCAIFLEKVKTTPYIPYKYIRDYIYDKQPWEIDNKLTWSWFEYSTTTTDTTSDCSTIYSSNLVSEDYGNLGTEFGARENNKIELVDFERQQNPECVFTIRYDDKKGLLKKGIKFSKPKKKVGSAFPLESNKWCNIPEDWNG